MIELLRQLSAKSFGDEIGKVIDTLEQAASITTDDFILVTYGIHGDGSPYTLSQPELETRPDWKVDAENPVSWSCYGLSFEIFSSEKRWEVFFKRNPSAVGRMVLCFQANEDSFELLELYGVLFRGGRWRYDYCAYSGCEENAVGNTTAIRAAIGPHPLFDRIIDAIEQVEQR